jgi:hypothetical protein
MTFHPTGLQSPRPEWQMTGWIRLVPAMLAFIVTLMSGVAAAGGVQASEADPAVISGTVSDFSGKPLAGASVWVKGDGFEDLYQATTDDLGRFSLPVAKRRYASLVAVRGYATEHLEYWFWGLDANADRQLDIRIGGLELYGLKAWAPHSGAMVYFRPMSLVKYQAFMQLEPRPDHIPIAPELTLSGVKARIDGGLVDVRYLQRVRETSDAGQTFDGYLMQVANPAPAGLQQLCVEIASSDTREQGMACTHFNGRHGASEP